jgi:hypothetical protein
MSSPGRAQTYHFGLKRRENRKASRRKVGETAWIRPDGGFGVRPCKVVDLSDTGVQITCTAGDSIAGVFTFSMSRDTRSGRRVRVKWRRGLQIGGEFI